MEYTTVLHKHEIFFIEFLEHGNNSWLFFYPTKKKLNKSKWVKIKSNIYAVTKYKSYIFVLSQIDVCKHYKDDGKW